MCGRAIKLLFFHVMSGAFFAFSKYVSNANSCIVLKNLIILLISGGACISDKGTLIYVVLFVIRYLIT